MTSPSSLSRRKFLATATAAVAAPTYLQAQSASYVARIIRAGSITPVVQWTDAMLQAVRDRGIAPPPASRLFAIGHMAGFVAADAITREYQPHFRLPAPPAQANPAVAYGAAVATAISRTAGVNTRRMLASYLNGYADGDGKGYGVTWGEHVGNMIVNWRANDGSRRAGANVYHKHSGPMAWKRTYPHFGARNGPRLPKFADPLLPGWGRVQPWGVADATAYRARPFPKMGSRDFEHQLQKVHAMGGWQNNRRSADQTRMAFFWLDGPGTVTPPGHWQIIALKLLQRKPMSFSEQARAMAMFSMAQADSAIAAWDSKYAYDIVRPETVIRDGDMQTPMARKVHDPNWQTLIPTPPFPAYTSGHSSFSGASARMLAKLMGTDRVSFSDTAPDLIYWRDRLAGVVRNFSSIWAAAEENGASREYGGVHWEADNTEGLRIGRAIADEIYRKGFRRA